MERVDFEGKDGFGGWCEDRRAASAGADSRAMRHREPFGLPGSGAAVVTPGAAGADLFVFSGAVVLSGNLNGGGGSDTADYSAYNTALTFDLSGATNTTTGITGTWINLTSGLKPYDSHYTQS